VASGAGLDLLGVAGTPDEARIKRLAHDDDVANLACRRAVERLREQGIKVDRVPGADMASSALKRIIQRLSQRRLCGRV
jgi:hypothetical protein